VRFLIVTKKATTEAGRSVHHGHLKIGSLSLPCALGRAGTVHDKREGDMATPAGSWPLLAGYYRADRGPRPKAWQVLTPLRRDMGWCDDPLLPSYNRPVQLPFLGSHELMWRDDGLYDVVIVLGHNLHPRRKNRGSAIFLHCVREGFQPTAGCIALRASDLRRLLPRLSVKAVLIVR
jgi:L,D-peptidoglycan transpeptidase YkuD (ErfK/YbiS/YcfS/YnhG family)